MHAARARIVPMAKSSPPRDVEKKKIFVAVLSKPKPNPNRGLIGPRYKPDPDRPMRVAVYAGANLGIGQ